MKSIFFCAPYTTPGAPNEVNRNLIKCLKGKVYIIGNYKGVLARLDVLCKILISKIIVISGGARSIYEMRLMRLLRKKIIYIMHGCASLETGQEWPQEDYVLKHSNLILCVSNSYRIFMQNRYPEYAVKMDVLYNGINWKEYEKLSGATKCVSKNYNRIILFGGGRQLKNNYDVCLAVQELNKRYNKNIQVDVYGYYNDTDDSPRIDKIPCVSFHSVIPHEDIIVELSKSAVYIQNSDFESFGLGLIDALNCGCSILLTRNIGVTDIINALKPSDIISNPHDIEELVEKINGIFSIPNNHRLLSSIDKTETSIEKAAENLLQFCRKYE